MSNMHLFNFKNYELQRKIEIQTIKGLTKSTQLTNFNFIVHILDDYDYHYIAKSKEDRDEIFDYLKAAYFDLMK